MSDEKVVSHVSDTARWVAVYRAMESERPDAYFNDPYARRLAGAQGEAIVAGMPKGRAMAWPMIVRTIVMDDIIRRLVGQGVDTVINLAAGLDTRPYRMGLPAALRWVEVDFPDMIQYKEEQLSGEQPTCALERVPLDLADTAGRQAVFQRIGAASRNALIVSEGLLVYLPAEAVAGLARDLHDQAAFHWWLTDLGSPGLLKMMNKRRGWGPILRDGGAPFLFGPEENTGFFAPYGWREAEYRSLFDESIRLNRTMPMARFWKFIGRLFPKRKQEEFARFSGVTLLERS